ncbi:MAG: hypothetical protein P8K79_11280 [Mariniblastus sp.]|nr:hypothetical protein [Mariniblastus sp.]
MNETAKAVKQNQKEDELPDRWDIAEFKAGACCLGIGVITMLMFIFLYETNDSATGRQMGFQFGLVLSAVGALLMGLCRKS